MNKTFLTARLVGPVVQITVTAESIAEAQAKQFVSEACEVVSAMGPRVIVDFGSVKMIASAGLGALVELHRACESNGGAVAIYNASPNIVTGFKLTRLNRLFKIAKDEAAAAKAVT